MKEEEILQLVRERMKDRPKIVSMFENCYQDTLEDDHPPGGRTGLYADRGYTGHVA